MVMEKQLKTLSVRVDPVMDVWLTERAKDHGRYLSSEIMDILTEKMKSDPLTIVLREFTTPREPVHYFAAWGESLDSFADDASEDTIFKKINDELARRNLRLKDVSFDRRRERVGFAPAKDDDEVS
jgi:hypothetical protein